VRGPFVVHRADRREPRGRHLAQHARAQPRAGRQRDDVPRLHHAEHRLEGLVLGLQQHVERAGPVGLARGHPALPQLAVDAAVEQHAQQPPLVHHADEAPRRPAGRERAQRHSLAAPGQFGERQQQVRRGHGGGSGFAARCGNRTGLGDDGTRHRYRDITRYRYPVSSASEPASASGTAVPVLERAADHAQRGPEVGGHGVCS
jgi:hypothetical protein